MVSISLFSDMFTDSQLFIMFEFADCGRDLESYEVSTLNGLKFRNSFLLLLSNKILVTGVIKFRINQDFLIEHSCILHIRSNLLLL